MTIKHMAILSDKYRLGRCIGGTHEMPFNANDKVKAGQTSAILHDSRECMGLDRICFGEDRGRAVRHRFKDASPRTPNLVARSSLVVARPLCLLKDVTNHLHELTKIRTRVTRPHFVGGRDSRFDPSNTISFACLFS